MNRRRCQRLAELIALGLRERLGVVLDTTRVLDDALYARDVLLVCDAYRGQDLAELAQHFRAARDEPVALPQAARAAPAASNFGAPSSGLDTHGSGFVPSNVDTDTPPDTRTLQRRAARAARSRGAWWSPGRWLGGDA
jgi:hypothetical protein